MAKKTYNRIPPPPPPKKKKKKKRISDLTISLEHVLLKLTDPWEVFLQFKVCYFKEYSIHARSLEIHDDVIKWIFRITGHLYGEFTGHRWIHKGQ